MITDKTTKTVHSRMRRQSSALVMIADKNLAIGVLFDVDHDVIVRKRCFQRSNTLKFQKTSRTFSVLILGQCHGVLISVKPIRKRSQKEVQVLCLLVFALSSHAGSLLPMFTCVW